MKIYMNGKLVDKKDAKVSVFDHGLLYGDGVFEGIRAYNGLVFSWMNTLTVCTILPRPSIWISAYRRRP